MGNEELGKLKYSADSLDKVVREFKDELVRLQGLLDAKTGKIKEPKPYPIEQITQRMHIHEAGRPEYSSYGSSEPRPSLALSRAAKAYEESKSLVEENQKICAENARIVSYLLDSIRNAGIPERVEVVVSGPRAMRTKREMQDAPWKRIWNMVKTRDTWPECEQHYKDFLQRVAKWQQEIDTKAAEEQRKKDQEKARIEAASKRIALCLKYGFDPVKTDERDLRDLLLKKNKYLRLAYYLERNRGDWSEGPDFAESGLSGFTIDTPDDKLIYDDIQDHITNWDGDGRVFRDCTWNYGRIYSEFVPAELLSDFREIKGDE